MPGKEMGMIRRKMLENLRWRLITQMEHLQGAAGRTAVRMKNEAGSLADMIDRAAAEQERGVELTIRDRESREIRQIRETLARIDSGQFGDCAGCGEAIDTKRLLLAPMSRLCTACKAKVECHRNHGGGSLSGYRVSEYHAD
jgi:DnaK suppressor protein